MTRNPIDALVRIGFSEYEAKAYLALLRKNPVTGYELSKQSGVPRSMIYEVVGKLVARGAAMILHTGDTTKYAPVPPEEFLDQWQREHDQLVAQLREDLSMFAAAPDLEYVWNLEGRENIIGRAREMISQAEQRVHVALLPDTLPALRDVLEQAVERGVRVVVYTTEGAQLKGGRVVTAPVSEETLTQSEGLRLILVVDGREVLVGEWLSESQARASWTSSPLLVFIAEHHLRTDLYLPQVLALLGERAIEVIQEEDQPLFARAMESYIKREQ
jgi:sugar-specific transcriptional regulator TrmB